MGQPGEAQVCWTLCVSISLHFAASSCDAVLGCPWAPEAQYSGALEFRGRPRLGSPDAQTSALSLDLTSSLPTQCMGSPNAHLSCTCVCLPYRWQDRKSPETQHGPARRHVALAE